jgi:hypothetical protein
LVLGFEADGVSEIRLDLGDKAKLEDGSFFPLGAEFR